MSVMYTIVLAIISCFWYIVAGALFLGIVFLAIRHDLVSAAIARELHRQTPVIVTVVDDDEQNYYWTNAARRLTFEAVPPAVRIQILINLLQKFKADRLDPMDKRLKTVTARLTRMMATYRRARMAYDFETSELYELCASNIRLTMSVGTNTEYGENSMIYKPRIVKKELESLNKEVSIVEPSVQSLSEKPLTSDVKSQSKSIHSVEKSQSGSLEKSSDSTVQPTQPESLTETLNELAASLISVIAWFKNALTSNVYRRKAVAVYQAINSTLNSQYLKTFFKFVFDSFDKIVKLYTHIDMDDTDITKVMIRIPATENDEE
ncbi:uncharacterized protein LOC100569951 [Acyrthosiphon pisum]|uniref:Uncharacterized protein n=1 Tax=Acyrthosiphon pisum TaxID=7029 RepID=A0A8R1W8Y9_ACYPI|nr:uncharacterized protein LOC100569951 [Acyrthosiphon pisum]|eukprot:XP_003246329.1 PREDICTED: uncharacterized protein LOC100569951 [Acyrthosiphon pisum]